MELEEVMSMRTWRQTRLGTVTSIRRLAKYVDNVGQLSSLLTWVREAVFCRSVSVSRQVREQVECLVSWPVVLGGAGVAAVTMVSRVLGVGGVVSGTCLGVVGGLVTIIAGRENIAQVMVCTGTLYLCSRIIFGLGSHIIGRVLIWSGNFMMVFSVTFGVLDLLACLALYIAVPALNTEILRSKFVRSALEDIQRDEQASHNIADIIEDPQLQSVVLFKQRSDLMTSEEDIINLAEIVIKTLRQHYNTSKKLQSLANDLENSSNEALTMWSELQECQYNTE